MTIKVITTLSLGDMNVCARFHGSSLGNCGYFDLLVMQKAIRLSGIHIYYIWTIFDSDPSSY